MVLVLLFGVALVLRLWGIGFGLPYPYHYDELFYVATALWLGKGVLHNSPYGATLLPNMLFVAYAVYFAVGWLTGRFPSAQAFEAAYRADPSTIYLLARVMGAALGAATVPALYGLGRRTSDRLTGLVGALLLAVAFLHVRDSHYGVPDVSMVLLVVMAVALAAAGLRERRRARVALAGLAGGLAVAMKWTALPVFLPVLWASVALSARPARDGRRRFADGWVLVPLLLFALGFALGSPQILLNPSPYLREAVAQSQADRLGGFDYWIVDTVPGWLFYLKTLLVGVGAPLLVLSLVGAARRLWLACRRADSMSALLLLFPAVYFVLMGGTRHYFARYALPLVPFAGLFAAEAVVSAGGWIARRKRRLGWAVGSALVVVALAWPLACSVRHNQLLTRDDTRTLAREWLERLPPESRIAADWLTHQGWYGLPGLETIEGIGLATHSLEWYQEQGFDYLVTSSFLSQIPLVDPQANAAREGFYAQLDDRLNLVAEFKAAPGEGEPPFAFDEIYGPWVSLWQRERPGPTIKIYRVGDGR